MSSDLMLKILEVGLAMQEYQAAVDDFDREMARILRVNSTDLRCLEILMSDPDAEITPRTIAERLGLTTGSVTTMIDRLERAGYLARAPHADDRRKTLVRITAAGRERAWSLLEPLLEASTADVAEHFDVDELDVVHRFVTRATALQQQHVARLRGEHAR